MPTRALRATAIVNRVSAEGNAVAERRGWTLRKEHEHESCRTVRARPGRAYVVVCAALLRNRGESARAAAVRAEGQAEMPCSDREPGEGSALLFNDIQATDPGRRQQLGRPLSVANAYGF